MEEMLGPLSSAYPLHLNSNQFLSSVILVLRHTKVTLLTPCSRPTQCRPGQVLSHLWKPAIHPYLLYLGPSRRFLLIHSQSQILTMLSLSGHPSPHDSLCSCAKQLLLKLWHLLHSFCSLLHHTVLYLALPNDQL